MRGENEIRTNEPNWGARGVESGCWAARPEALQACTNLFVRQDASFVDGFVTFFDFADEPLVVVRRPFQGLERQRIQWDAAQLSHARQSYLQIRRQVKFHVSSLSQNAEPRRPMRLRRKLVRWLGGLARFRRI